MGGLGKGLDEEMGCVWDKELGVGKGNGDGVDQSHMGNIGGASEERDKRSGNECKVSGVTWGGKVMECLGYGGYDLEIALIRDDRRVKEDSLRCFYYEEAGCMW